VRIRDTHDSTRGDISAQVFAISESETRPTLFAPTHQSEGVSTRPRFRWIPFAGAVSYHLQVTSDPGMSFWTIEENDLTTSSFQATELDRDTKYFWRVRARRADNSLSEWSVMWSFTTSGSSLAAPAHYLPLEGALGISTTVNLFWLAAEDADAYHLQVSRTEDFSDLVLEETGLTGLTFAVSGLSHEDDYWWRLRSGNTGSTAFSDWSRPWKFSTAPPPPRQLTPFDGLPDVPLRPLLIWYPTDGARAYHLQVALDDRFNSMVFDSSNIRGTTVQLRSLAGYTTYWWRLTVTTFEDLVVSPNPFRPGIDERVMIDGLVEGAVIKILSVSGNLVAEIASPGGRVGFWDGRTTEGEYAASGVYFVVAAAPNGSQAATAKLAVVRP
jgi:hypothetical protein